MTVMQVYSPTTDAEEGKGEQSYENPQHLLKLIPKKDVHFIIGDWNAKARSQEIPRITGKVGIGGQNEAGQRLTALSREHADHSKHPIPTT